MLNNQNNIFFSLGQNWNTFFDEKLFEMQSLEKQSSKAW